MIPERKNRTIHEHIAHVQEMGRYCKPGARVIVAGSGRTGTVTKPAIRHNGPEITWDEPVFGVTKGRVMLAGLEKLS